MLAAFVLCWLWLQSRQHLQSMHKDESSQLHSDRVVRGTIGSLLLVSGGLLITHFVLPEAEAAANTQWAVLVDMTLDNITMNASGHPVNISASVHMAQWQ